MPSFAERVRTELLPALEIRSTNPRDPVEVVSVPKPWRLIGAGNYAAVVAHPDERERVVKVYAEGRPGLRDEIEVYRRLGRHPAYSECYDSGETFLILKRLTGVTLYECLRRGIRIPERVIRDIDEALEYARGKGLNPHDVHGKNVMMIDGRGVVVDVSDFLKDEYCSMWDDLKKSYYMLYKPILYRFPIPIPHALLNLLRKGYRLFRKRGSC
ncbi:serine/threonine protein kinase [Paenibacillus flagellatus]|uniref:Serine/threonine protein kinase n=1 Tax=Paenibacillus flagellatus TaxID=2211139 RepID=A0A2V5KAD9_9BACL|nr:serine/threonine protein kinase [Paenibacillus flagellatus]PYI54823.1 serine/threonine protein kinase [Paenibacillus flagellatus]